MPPEIIHRANEILQQLEDKHASVPDGQKHKNISAPKVQLSIFDVHTQTFNQMREILESIDINRLTPVEALMKLNEVKSLLKS